MSIQLIAVDMDGTFSAIKKPITVSGLWLQYQQMKAQGIRFVIASGNQYYQLISFFPEIANEIAFVAERHG
ncbi:HAD hydrolase family protein [Shigella flexneri]